MLKKDSRRSKLEIYIDVLRVLAHNGPLTLTHIMYKSNVNCTVLKTFLDSLSQQNLVEEQIVQKRKQRKITYAITERGRTTLNYFKEIRMALQPNEEIKSPYVFV
jgi:predicted transcriptional regulator